MDIRVGDVWECADGDRVEIVKTDGDRVFEGVPQPIETRCGLRFSAEGWFGETLDSLPQDNLVRLVSRAGETAEETILPGEEFGEEKFEIARKMQDSGAKFEYWDADRRKWCEPVGRRASFKDTRDRYRLAEPRPDEESSDAKDVAPDRPLRLMIVGHGRHGKDTVANILADELNLSFCSSSWYCAKAFVFDALRFAFDYPFISECYEDRNSSQQMRDLWHALITAYNRKDPARLSREIFAEADIYVGIRSSAEFQAAKAEGLFDLAIWVQADQRLIDNYEAASSFEISREDCDIILDNNGTEEDLEERVVRLARVLKASL